MDARRLITLSALALFHTAEAPAQTLPAQNDTRHSILREVALGVLRDQRFVSELEARRTCLGLPAEPAEARLESPHGDSLIASRCQVVSYDAVGREKPARWAIARYRWVSTFTAEDSARGAGARDTVPEEEVVLFESARVGWVRPAWHGRVELGIYGVWRSIDAQVATADAGTTLLSVRHCLNGTGGCGQEFLRRHADGAWFAVWQVWTDSLPPSYAMRLWKGAHIDPATLRGEAGLYSERDGNCCPSQKLLITLGLRGDSLVLKDHAVAALPPP